MQIKVTIDDIRRRQQEIREEMLAKRMEGKSVGNCPYCKKPIPSPLWVCPEPSCRDYSQTKLSV